MSTAPTQTFEQLLLSVLEAMIAADPVNLRLAQHEGDTDTTHVPDAARFIKARGKRVGRDLELYARTFSEAVSEEYAVGMFLDEVIMPIQGYSSVAYAVGLSRMLDFKVFGERQDTWEAMLNMLRAPFRSLATN